MQTPTLPRYIALCGNPRAGKSMAQKILHETYGVTPIDDGEPLRRFGIQNLGMTRGQVYTQKGKLETVEIAGAEWQVRKALGELGNAIEATFGKHILPFMAMEQTKVLAGESFSFGSVRRDQGLAYKAAGGVVIGIENPQAGPSGNEFDTFDASVVDAWIYNDALYRGFPIEAARRDLEHKVWAALMELSLTVRAPMQVAA